MRRRFAEMQALMAKSITSLGELNQNEMVGDIFEIYFNEHVMKMKSNDADIKAVEDEYLFKLCELCNKYGEKTRVASLM